GVELLDAVYQFVASLDGSLGLPSRTGQAEDLVPLCHRLSEGFHPGSAKVQPGVGELGRIRQRLVKLIGASLKAISDINPKYRIIKPVAPEEVPEVGDCGVKLRYARMVSYASHPVGLFGFAARGYLLAGAHRRWPAGAARGVQPAAGSSKRLLRGSDRSETALADLDGCQVEAKNLVVGAVDYHEEYLASRLWTLVSQINARVHRSISALDEDPTVLVSRVSHALWVPPLKPTHLAGRLGFRALAGITEVIYISGFSFKLASSLMVNAGIGDTILEGSLNLPATRMRLASDARRSFREVYMESVTETYGDELNRLREAEEFTQARLELLIDSIESGMALFSESDRALLVGTPN
ncbi:hypothetical protein L0F63_001177, partial [Massospora cicadina]